MLSLRKAWVRLPGLRKKRHFGTYATISLGQFLLTICNRSVSKTSSGSLNCLFKMAFLILKVPVVVMTTAPLVL